MDAVKLLNEVGSKRGTNGMPELLPGLNFVFGLEGETKKTFELNYNFLQNIFISSCYNPDVSFYSLYPPKRLVFLLLKETK